MPVTMDPTSVPHVISDAVLEMLKVPSTATLTSALTTVSGIKTAFMHGVSPLKAGLEEGGAVISDGSRLISSTLIPYIIVYTQSRAG
jgi:hypothetical protein